MEALEAVFAFAFSLKFWSGIAVGAGFHRFWSRKAVAAYKSVKGRL